MSYTEFEQSDYESHPLEMYRFSLGGKKWLYTSADHVVAALRWDERYQPVYIQRTGFTKSGDARKSTMDIEVAATNEVALLFRDSWLTGILIVTVYRRHHEDDDFSILWKGRVTGCKWAGSVATLASESVNTTFQRAGLRRVYQVGCPHVLFGGACGLSAADWGVPMVVSSANGKLLSVGNAGDFGTGYFLGGMLQSGDDLRMITAHAADAITLVDGLASLTRGSEVTLYPGCMHTVNACASKFDNLDNYGGLPFLPAKNPFSGDALV